MDLSLGFDGRQTEQHLAGLASAQEQQLDNIFPVFTIVFDLCVDRIVYCAGRYKSWDDEGRHGHR